jgi:hypothetical protein
VPACGRALPGHEIRIVDEAGANCPTAGSAACSSAAPRRRAAITATRRRRRACSRRLARFGRLRYLVEGEVYLTGRVKDVIIRGGRNLYPYELEEAVGALPGVRKGCVAVFASTDPANATERLVVMAETRERDPAAREALRQKINEATPRRCIGMPADEIVLAPPHGVLKTSSGKIRRAASREAFFPEGTFGRASGLQPFKLGAFVVAAETATPLVPVTLNGTRSLLRDESWLPRRQAVQVLIGPPITPAGKGWEHALELRDAARKAIGLGLTETSREL